MRWMGGILRPEHSPQTSVVMLGPVIVLDGHVAGRWRRVPGKGSVAVEAAPFAPLGEGEMRAIESEARRHRAFTGARVTAS